MKIISHKDCTTPGVVYFVAAHRKKKDDECCLNCKYGGKLVPGGYIPEICTRDTEDALVPDAEACICKDYKRR